jgi:hypothetical protein
MVAYSSFLLGGVADTDGADRDTQKGADPPQYGEEVPSITNLRSMENGVITYISGSSVAPAING